MMKHTLTALFALAASSTAQADSRKLLVLQSEGRADPATRAKIDAAILKLASAAEPQASAGELNFSDAATAVGCNPDAPSCKDEVLSMLAVDEIVITKLAPRPGGLEVSVRRIRKGGASRDASVVIPAGEPADKLDGIAPVFGDRSPAPQPTERAPHGEDHDRPDLPPPSAAAAQELQPAPVGAAPASDLAAAPVDAPHQGRRRLQIAGMAGGGGMVVLGVLLWSAARGVQDDIDDAPTRTAQDLLRLRDLESKGDTYARLGNVLALSGLVVGGIATYYFLRDRRAASTATARLAPTVFDHGAGLVLTIGGSP